ncbi:MAG TPA: PIN domain nuclease [Spirochaetota bacterium]|nr:PIN domain nuclease [Spirochaetota bacterium]HOM38238.1 PIN domain nuclease [Spirochaetota bacterium]HPQ48544.1 PIN domain nuclease [Spirochaetota bacterium]
MLLIFRLFISIGIGVLSFFTSADLKILYSILALVITFAILNIDYFINPKLIYPIFIGFIGFGFSIWVGLNIIKLMDFYKIEFLKNSPFLIFFILSLLGFYLGFRGSSKLEIIVPEVGKKEKADNLEEVVSASIKILDTSSIIDSRIIDICETGFIEGVVLIPKFVLNELQMVADSTDPNKRSRGRKGLTELSRLKKVKNVKVKIIEKDFSELREVDDKLIRLAKEIQGTLITTDYNLNKLASLEGIRVLNVNELANALKPIVMANEELRITLIKEGKERSQGVGYLPDGTMVVVENGKNYLGQEVDVVVTSILQTPAGRMIFAQLKNG